MVIQIAQKGSYYGISRGVLFRCITVFQVSTEALELSFLYLLSAHL